MKRFPLIALCAAGLFAQNPQIHSIYVLPMAGGLDQYLAQTIAADHALQISVDARTADAILTDHLGAAFEQQLDLIAGKEKEQGADSHPLFRTTTGRGTVFLVDAKSRRVLWSDYEKPSRATPARIAERIARKLQRFTKQG
jgi:hypothetical protein